MALYTGIEAYTNIKGVTPVVISKTPFYNDYINVLYIDESNGGYPPLNYILDLLSIEDVDDTNENYEKYHKQYTKEIEEIQNIVNEIDKYNLLERVKTKEVAFITRNYELAQKFREFFNQSEFYFRRVVSYDELVRLVEEIKDTLDLSWTLEKAREFKGDYIFEVHVS